MAKIYPYKRQLTPSGQGKIALKRRPTYPTYHWRALAGLGGKLTNVASDFVERLSASERDTQVSNSEVASLKEWNEFQQKMRLNPQGADFLPGKQTSGWLDKWEKGKPQRIKAVLENITNPTARKIAERRFEKSEAIRAGMIQGDAWKQSAQNQEDSYKMNLAYLLNAPMQTEQDRDNLIAQVQTLHINAAKNNLSGMQLPGIAQKAINVHTQAINERYARQYLYNTATSLGWEEGLKWLNKPENVKGYPAEIVDAVVEDVRTQATIQKRIADEQLEEKKEKDRDEIFDRREDGTITRPFIEASSLDQTEQERLWQESKKEHTTDPAVYWPLWEEASKMPPYATLEERIALSKKISAAVGNGITAAQRKELNELIKKDEGDPLKTPSAGYYFDMVTALYAPTKEEIEKKEKGFAEKMAKYDRTNKTLRRHFLENPDESPEQRANWFQKEIIGPELPGYFERFIKFIKRGGYAGDVYRKIFGEEKPQEAKDIKLQSAPDTRLYDYWGQLTDKQKQDIWKHNNNPDKMDDIVRMIEDASS